MNPYSNARFFDFFLVLLKRIFLFCTGENVTWASDEIQILILSMLAISCGLLGSFLILRKMSMLANSLSHTILIGVVGAYLLFQVSRGEASINLPIMLTAALISALLTAVITEVLTKFFRLQEDASIGLVFTALFALGVILVTTFTRNAHIGSEIVMGNVDALHIDDLKTAGFLVIMNISLTVLFYRRLQITTFDPLLAKTLGVSVSFCQYLLLFFTASTVIGAFRAVGVILVLAFLVGPYLTARMLTHRLIRILFLSPLFGISASVIGVALSRHFFSSYAAPVSTGALVVVIIGLQFCLVFAKTSFQRKKKVCT